MKNDFLWKLERIYVYCRQNDWTDKAHEVGDIYGMCLIMESEIKGVRNKFRLMFVRLMPTIHSLKVMKNVQ